MIWFYLFLAIVGEVVATTALKASEGFTQFWPSLTAVLGYGVAFYLLAHVLKTLPVGITYAIWAGLGMASVTLIGVVYFGQKLDIFGYLGIALIVSGVVVLNALSKSV